MSRDSILQSHLREMGKKASPLYSVLEKLHGQEPLLKEAAKLVDLAIGEELEGVSNFPETIESIAGLQPVDAEQALAAWVKAVAAARPERRAMKVILESFGEWFQELVPATRGAFFDNLPKLAPAAWELRGTGIRAIAEAAKPAASDDQSRVVLGAVASYSDAFGGIILGVASIGRRSLEHGGLDLFERLVTLLPLEKIEERGDSRKLIPELARVSDSYAAAGATVWRNAVSLCLAVLQKNISSAYAVATGLSSAAAQLPPEQTGAYFEDFETLVNKIGIGCIGVGLRDLPGFYRHHGLERTRRFVQEAARSAELYGAKAGQWFLERRTQAAKDALTREL